MNRLALMVFTAESLRIKVCYCCQISTSFLLIRIIIQTEMICLCFTHFRYIQVIIVNGTEHTLILLLILKKHDKILKCAKLIRIIFFFCFLLFHVSTQHSKIIMCIHLVGRFSLKELNTEAWTDVSLFISGDLLQLYKRLMNSKKFGSSWCANNCNYF